MTFGSGRWVLAHVSAMVAFGCLYGAEAFGLHAIGRAAVEQGASHLTAVVDAVRYNPVALTMFGAGLIVLAVTSAALARVLWTSGVASVQYLSVSGWRSTCHSSSARRGCGSPTV